MKRLYIFTIITVVIALLAVAAWFVSANRLVAARPTPTNQTLGIADSLQGLSADELNARLDSIAAMHVRWIRFDIQWSRVEADGRGQYNWQETDRIVQAVAAHHMEPVAMVGYAPEWARLEDCQDDPMCAPAKASDYADFAAAATARYHKTIRYWEIWNEPNTAHFFQPAADPGRYADLLKAAYPRIKSIDGSAVVLTGGTAPTSTGGGNYVSTDFLSALYDHGAAGNFDIVAHHPYTYPATPAKSKPDDAWGQLQRLHDIMTKHGDGNKQLWATEYGFPTGGPGNAATDRYPTPGSARYVSEDREADFLADAIASYHQYAWAGPLFWYSYQDAGSNKTDPENFFGLVRTDGTHKPAYDAFVAAVIKGQ